jgi:FlaA1/EpsC-like NDP-sugar epimerase
MITSIRNRHFFISDLILLPAAVYTSFVLRLEHLNLERFWHSYLIFSACALLAIPLSLALLGCYSRYWPYASTEDVLLLVVAVSPVIVVGLALQAVNGLWPALGLSIPRSIPFILFPFALGAITFSRLSLRLGPQLASHYRRHRPEASRKRRVLVFGAGDAGETIVRDLRRNKHLDSEVVGFLDDDSSKHGMRIRGVSVLGSRAILPQVVKEQGVDQVIIAIATASGKAIRELALLCERAGVEAKIIPGIHELIGGTVSLSQVRDIQVEDLLRREPIQTNTSTVRALLRGRRVLITGGGGSIGSELCRQVLECEPAELMILGHGENSVFEIHNELQKRLDARPTGSPSVTLHTVIADIRSPERILTVFSEYRPEIVFHAAAHKHVPLMELNPAEAVTNNILGTRNLLDAALEVGVAHFVMISSDKAVNPTSIMGASKRAAELLVHNTAVRSGKPYVAVRFGNVLGSRGSVVLTFKKQIAAGGPITVTDPEMRRFFMTIPEAVQLVLQAAPMGRGGEVFLLDMGEPVKIVDLAHDMIELSGLRPGHDIDIRFTGLRPGEKLYEELFIPGEEYQRTEHEKVFIVRSANAALSADLLGYVDELRTAAYFNDVQRILAILRVLVPQFQRPEPAQAVAAQPGALRLERAVGGTR